VVAISGVLVLCVPLGTQQMFELVGSVPQGNVEQLSLGRLIAP